MQQPECPECGNAVTWVESIQVTSRGTEFKMSCLSKHRFTHKDPRKVTGQVQEHVVSTEDAPVNPCVVLNTKVVFNT